MSENIVDTVCPKCGAIEPGFTEIGTCSYRADVVGFTVDGSPEYEGSEDTSDFDRDSIACDSCGANVWPAAIEDQGPAT